MLTRQRFTLVSKIFRKTSRIWTHRRPEDVDSMVRYLDTFTVVNLAANVMTQLSEEISDIHLTSPFDFFFFIKSEVFPLDKNNLLIQLFIYFVQAHLFIDITHTQKDRNNLKRRTNERPARSCTGRRTRRLKTRLSNLKLDRWPP